jgi:hypothetical protein
LLQAPGVSGVRGEQDGERADHAGQGGHLGAGGGESGKDLRFYTELSQELWFYLLVLSVEAGLPT